MSPLPAEQPLHAVNDRTIVALAALNFLQALYGIGDGLIALATPVAVERLLAGIGRFDVGLAAVMTLRSIGASLSNVVAGWGCHRGRL